MKKILIALIVSVFALLTILPMTVFGAKNYILETPDYGNVRDTMSDTWVAVDDLGREVSTGDTVRDVQEEKQVLMFYYTWHLPMHVQNIYNIADILKTGAATGRYNWGGSPSFHYWDEPYFGYYKSDDPWVIRKDIQMLCDAGVDGVFFDAGNGYLYHDAYKAFFEENMERKAEGQSYLKATWMIKAGGPLNSVSNVLKELYNKYYKTGEYDDVLYTINGKPLMLCPSTAPNSTELKNFFEVRDCWAWASGAGKWPWLEDSPQKGGWALGNTSRQREMVSVAAAQHPTTNMGKSYSNGKQPAASKQQPEKGIYFTEQWTRALQLDPQFVLVTQWNEWMAQRFLSNGSDSFLGKTLPSGETYFVDVYSAEYSRDIAPMKGGYGDNYYYLLADYIRQFKGARENPVITKTQTVNVKDFSTINSSGTVYYDDLYDTMHRDHPCSASSQNYHYKDTSGRNDFEEVRVASDANNIYFYVRTVDNITSPEGTNWMNLMLNIDANYKTGWHGYDYLVNRVRVGNKATIERFDASGKYELEYVADAEISYSGKEMVIGISRSSIRIPGNSFTVDFKFADNIPEEDDIMLFIDKGDVAPNNRFNYRYIFGSKTINVVPDTATPSPLPEPAPETELKINGKLLSLSSDIAVKYVVKKAEFDAAGYTNPKLAIAFGNEESVIDCIIDIVSGIECYVFSFENVAPQMMNDTIEAKLYAEWNNKEYSSETVEYSVATYIYSMLSSTTNAKFKTMLVDMLRYGSAAQVYTKHNTANLVDSKLTAEQAAWGTSSVRKFSTVKEIPSATASDSVKWVGMSLYLDNKVAIRGYFDVPSTEGIFVEVTDENGVVQGRITEEDFTEVTGPENTPVVSFIYDDLNFAQMSKTVKITVYDKAGNKLSGTAVYSIESYAYSLQNSTATELANLVKAMVVFGDASLAYLN